MKKAIGYIRVSSDEQIKDGESLERQEQQIKAYAQFKGFDLEIIRDEGISGYTIKHRPGMKQLIEQCKEKTVNFVIVYDLSRLSRSVKETLILIEDVFQKNGVEFISLNNDIDTSSPMGKMFLTFTAMINQSYRDEISWKTKNALKYKKEKGEKTGGNDPMGFQSIEKDGKKILIKDEEEQKAIDLIRELKGNGWSVRKIKAELEARGIKTANGKSNWHVTSVQRIISRL